jgi:hypothetical protein
MSYGLQVYDEYGNIRFDTSTITFLVLYTGIHDATVAGSVNHPLIVPGKTFCGSTAAGISGSGGDARVSPRITISTGTVSWQAQTTGLRGKFVLTIMTKR